MRGAFRTIHFCDVEVRHRDNFTQEEYVHDGYMNILHATKRHKEVEDVEVKVLTV
jgi:hypothetical protein